MNNQRRKKIEALSGQLEELKSKFEALIEGDLEQIRGEIDDLRNEEQEAYDNMPESFQNGDRGSNCQMAIDALQSAYDGLEGIEAVGVIDEAVSSLEEAVGQ